VDGRLYQKKLGTPSRGVFAQQRALKMNHKKDPH